VIMMMMMMKLLVMVIMVMMMIVIMMMMMIIHVCLKVTIPIMTIRSLLPSQLLVFYLWRKCNRVSN
jgi:hypothetical protein